VLENVKSDRSSLGCYHGVVSTAYIQALKDSINGLAGNGPAGSGPAGNGPPSGPPPAQGLSNREGPAATAAETAERLAANKSRVIILIDELDALGHGDLC
jgi:hypothetical protein